MRTVAVLPAKRFDRAKQRLGRSGVSASSRRSLSEAMLADVLDAIDETPAIDELIVVTSEPVAAQHGAGHNAEVVHDDFLDHNGATVIGLKRASRRAATRTLVVPGDCPLMNPGELAELLETPASTAVTIVPDRHGTGTNALLLCPPEALMPAFGPGSLVHHRTRAVQAGASMAVRSVPSLALDIDTADDLVVLDAALAERPGSAPRTREVLAALGRREVADGALGS